MTRGQKTVIAKLSKKRKSTYMAHLLLYYSASTYSQGNFDFGSQRRRLFLRATFFQDLSSVPSDTPDDSSSSMASSFKGQLNSE